MAVKAAIDSADPVGLLEMGAPGDEYDPATSTIVPRVAKAADATEVQRIIHEEFERWFGADANRSLASCDKPAREIWHGVHAFRQQE